MATTEAAYMRCPAPDVSTWKLDISKPIRMHYGFVMDGVTELLNISQEAGFQPLIYYPNPKVLPFSSVKRYVKGEPLSIKVSITYYLKHSPVKANKHSTPGDSSNSVD